MAKLERIGLTGSRGRAMDQTFDKEYETISTDVLSIITPSITLQRKLNTIFDDLSSRIRTIGEEQGLDLEILHVGSTAKGTNLEKGDLDIFLRFPVETSREALRSAVISIGSTVLDDHQVRYAEHPYVRGELDGIEIDLVPCYDIDPMKGILSAVDRTPFHAKYILEHLGKEQRNEVRVLKQFLKCVGCYGAENRTMGFSGYLAELFILHYKGFIRTLEAFSTISRGTIVDIEDAGYQGPVEKCPLIVVDPVDPGRNVASPVSEENMAHFIHACRRYLERPSLKFFFPAKRGTLSPEKLESILASLGDIVFLSFKVPDIIDDVLYPQLRNLHSRLKMLIKNHGFEIRDSGFHVADSVYMYFEMLTHTLPDKSLHKGPMIYIDNHEKKFLEKWQDFGPFLRGDRWFVFAPNKYRTFCELLENEIPAMNTSKSVGENMKKNFRVLYSHEVSPEILSLFLDRRMPWEI